MFIHSYSSLNQSDAKLQLNQSMDDCRAERITSKSPTPQRCSSAIQVTVNQSPRLVNRGIFPSIQRMDESITRRMSAGALHYQSPFTYPIMSSLSFGFASLIVCLIFPPSIYVLICLFIFWGGFWLNQIVEFNRNEKRVN